MSAAIGVVGVVGIGAALQQHAPGRDERDDVVDVAVGFRVLGDPVAQPDDPVDTERSAGARASISACVIPGLRFGLSRHRSVVTSVPAPSTAIEPPSSTSGTS